MQSRRRFLSLAAAGTGAALTAGLVPPSIARALAIAPNRRTGSIEDVEHVVIFMQENRSFDHYFGQLRGVRGHGDRFPISLAHGRSVFFQPSKADPAVVVSPFRLDTKTTGAQCVGDLDHSWRKTQAAMDLGKYDAWPFNKTDMTMGYHTREDLPFHYALADAFTICDNYFCSIPSQTHPNRTYLMTGMIDPDGKHGGPLLDNNDPVDDAKLPPLTWTTFPERLEAAGVSWQIYQQGTSWDDDWNGNYGTNVLANFKNFIDAPPGSSLYERGMSKRTLKQLEADVRADRLPSVSWLLPPAIFSEHPRFTPAYGADYTSQILDALTANPEVWAKTALFIMYDENDGFFDHIVPPQAPVSAKYGKSTVSLAGEIHHYVDPQHHPLYIDDGLPYGLGARVPMTVVSPWSKGGFVNSQVFDHTSLIQFVEKRFGVHEPNLTAWRRTVSGDLTSAFDFSKSDPAHVSLPSTKDYIAMADASCKLEKPKPPAVAADDVPKQEPGTRPARPLPYVLAADGHATGSSFRLAFANRGAAGAHFYVYGLNDDGRPRGYTLGSRTELGDEVALAPGAAYDVTVYGPNGFYRRFTGVNDRAHQPVAAKFATDALGNAVLTIEGATDAKQVATIADNAYGAKPVVVGVRRGKPVSHALDLRKSAQWYDVTVTVDGGYGRLSYRFAGHAENGKPSTSDPAMA